MKHISIGGLDVSRIGLGAMSMSGYYNIGAVNDAEPQVVDAVQGLGWRLATMQRQRRNRSGVVPVGLGKPRDSSRQSARCRNLGPL